MEAPGLSQNPALPKASEVDWHWVEAGRVTGLPSAQGTPTVMSLKLCACGEQVAPLMAPVPGQSATAMLGSGWPVGPRIGGMSYLTPCAKPIPVRIIDANHNFL